MPIFDVSINMLSLFTFILVLGIVVDDAIIVGENIYQWKERGFSNIEAAKKGANQVAIPVFFAVLTTITTFSPMLSVAGNVGPIWRIIPLVTIAAKEFVNRSIGIECETSMESMWTVHSYNGDYNPVHDHGTRTPMCVSLIYYLKVPRCIEWLGNPAEEFGGLNESSGNVDGFTYLTWGSNGMRDINMLRPITEEYIKPEVGTLIMFPSWLRHGVMPFFSDVKDDERRTFSANININLKDRLTGDHYRKDRAWVWKTFQVL